MTGPDSKMDLLGDSYFNPANPLPAKCRHCTFPDLEFVARPYLLAKGFASPAETAPARLGNFLVRERVRRILELVVPGACTFHPTADRKSKKATPWWLAVPRLKLEIPVQKPKSPFCSKCGEPKAWSCAMGPVWEKMHGFDTHGIDVFKTLSWRCPKTVEDDFVEVNRWRKKHKESPAPWSDWNVEPPAHGQRWTRFMLSRDLYFSTRLEQLLKRAKVKGQLVRSYYSKDVRLTAEDEAWIETKLRLLAKNGLAESGKIPKNNNSGAIPKWFKGFLSRNANRRPSKFDFAALKKKQKLALPQDYKDFVSIVGPMSFPRVMEIDGFTAKILSPTKLDFKNFRRGRVPDLDEEQSQIDGVMFAETDHGDSFVFDVSKGDGIYPVYWHDHEQNSLEAFASSFAECIRRFSDHN